VLPRGSGRLYGLAGSRGLSARPAVRGRRGLRAHAPAAHRQRGAAGQCNWPRESNGRHRGGRRLRNVHGPKELSDSVEGRVGVVDGGPAGAAALLLLLLLCRCCLYNSSGRAAAAEAYEHLVVQAQRGSHLLRAHVRREVALSKEPVGAPRRRTRVRIVDRAWKKRSGPNGCWASKLWQQRSSGRLVSSQPLQSLLLPACRCCVCSLEERRSLRRHDRAVSHGFEGCSVLRRRWRRLCSASRRARCKNALSGSDESIA